MAQLGFSNASFAQCDPIVASYMRNLTASYTDKNDEVAVASISIAMFILAATFFGLNLFSRSPDISATIQPTIRTLLSAGLVLFDPVMTYLFSNAKNASIITSGSIAPSRTGSGNSEELSQQARMILTWMLMVQLLRKKVEGFQAAAEWPENLGTILRQASPIIWLGYLVFANLKSVGPKAAFGTLWLLGAIKFLQRVITNELGKHSLASGKNARVVSSYMQTIVDEDLQTGDPDRPLELLKGCKFVVMGEEHLVEEAGPQGYHINIKSLNDNGNVLTVGKVWEVFSNETSSASQATDEEQNRSKHPNPRQLCLSFALFKLLRRRIEQLPPTSKSETDKCRRLMFQGLCKAVEKPEVALFQVMSDQISFLAEYYHSVFPVVHASPSFFLVNYIMVPITTLSLCIMVIILCGNGNVTFAFKHLKSDNYALSLGVFKLIRCLLSSFLTSPQVFFSTMELTITLLLVLTFLYEQIWELIVFLLSNWFAVSLIYSYTTSPGQRSNIRRAIPTFMWLRKQLIRNPGRIELKQFSVLSFCRLPLFSRTKPMPVEAKSRIMNLLSKYDECSRNPLDKGLYTLESNQEFSDLSWACRSESIAEVILTWHIATGLLFSCQDKGLLEKIAHPHQRSHLTSARDAAIRLSRYCAYLVASHPELLPDDHEGTKHIYKETKREMREKLGFCSYYFSTEDALYKNLNSIASNGLEPNASSTDMKIVEKGALLGSKLIDKVAAVAMEEESKSEVWNLLCDLWIELVVYIAPSSGDEHDTGHKKALGTGGDLVTLLWALTAHTGITRPSRAQIPVHPC